MIYASEYGFATENDGMTNARALQAALDMGGDVYVDKPGRYVISDTLYIGGHTSLTFCKGSVMVRTRCPQGQTSYFIVNKGAFTCTWDEDIAIYGLNLVTDGVFYDRVLNSDKYIPGLQGQVSFSYVKRLHIEDFVLMDLPAHGFAIQVCTFENIVLENLHIEGRKDGVHLGRGSKFVIRHGLFRTFDDPIALNAHDYSTSNPHMGWITDGVIEDCYDLDDDDTTGFFCRILAGSWTKWFKGMVVQNSDSVVHNGRVYRVIMPPDGRTFVSETAPCHESGSVEYDGIMWCMTQADETLSCGCKNIVFRDIYLQKKRPIAFALHFDKDNWSRSYYPNSIAPVQDNILLENVYVQNDIPIFVKNKTPMGTLKVSSCSMGKSHFMYHSVQTEGIEYPLSRLIVTGTTAEMTESPFITTEEDTPVEFISCGNAFDGTPTFSDNVTVRKD